MLVKWNRHDADNFPYRMVVLPYKERISLAFVHKVEIKNRRDWCERNCSFPIMVAMGGSMLCFSEESDAFAFKLRWL